MLNVSPASIKRARKVLERAAAEVEIPAAFSAAAFEFPVLGSRTVPRLPCVAAFSSAADSSPIRTQARALMQNFALPVAPRCKVLRKLRGNPRHVALRVALALESREFPA